MVQTGLELIVSEHDLEFPRLSSLYANSSAGIPGVCHYAQLELTFKTSATSRKKFRLVFCW